MLVWFVALAGLGSYAAAQVNTGNVYGNVIDEQGGVIPGGTATLIGPSAPMTTSVDANGLFRFLKVPPGTYAVTVTMPGFTTVTRENVGVSVNKNTQVDVVLKLSTVQEAVTVTSATPLIDTRKVETGQNFSKEQLTEIPTSRDIWSLIQQVPGVQLDTVNVAGNQSAQVGGPDFITKGSGNVAYQVDGATITDNTYGNPFARQNGGTNTFFDFSTFQDVEVATGGSLLEQQNSGVTINVVTKRGTNELKGSARYMYASGNWQSNNTPAEAEEQGLPTNNTRMIREYGADLGGPIVKDKLWLWFAGSYQTIATNSATFDSTEGEFSVPETTNLEPWSAKLNWQISNSNSAQLFYQRSDRDQNNRGAAPFRPQATQTSLVIPTNFYKVEDSNVFSSDFFASIFANYQNPDYTSLANGSKDCVAVKFQVPCNGNSNKDIQYYANGDGSNLSYYNNYVYYYAKDPQKQANLQMSKFFNTGSVNHELKFSFNYRQQIADSASGLPGAQNMGQYYSSGSSQYALLSRGVRTVYKTQYMSGTLGDTITWGNLTAQVGVRYDRQTARNLPGTSFANSVFSQACTACGYGGLGDFPGLPEVKYNGSSTEQFDYTNWQPRISATYALGEKKTTLLRGSYAQFADQLGFLGYYGSGVPISNGYYYYWTDINHDHIVQPNEVHFEYGVYSFYNGIDPSALPSNPNHIDSNFKTPLTTEWTFGVDQQLNDTLAVSGTFSYRTTKNLQQTLDNGAGIGDWALVDNANGTATAANGFQLNFSEPYYALTLPDEPTGVTLSNRPGATQRYYGVDFSVVKRMSDHWSARANFGWNNFTQLLTTASIQDPNNYWAQGGQNCGNPPQSSCPAVGYSSKDSVFINANWQFNVNAVYQAPLGIDFGVNLFGRQGYPNPYYVRTRARDAAGISHTYSILIDQVDTYRYPNVYELDFRLAKTFNIGGVTVVPAAELFNVANAGTVLQRYQRTGTYRNGEFDQSQYFNQILEVQSPRILRLGIQVNF
ncbi:MAG TPA: TonB-dependent receptor [Thermoanaerobaculia bacterium]|nr:TonB-dependent receptor [Thermoanaerobaculia bacterium]